MALGIPSFRGQDAGPEVPAPGVDAEAEMPPEAKAWLQRRLAFETFMRTARQAAGVPGPRRTPPTGRLRLIGTG